MRILARGGFAMPHISDALPLYQQSLLLLGDASVRGRQGGGAGSDGGEGEEGEGGAGLYLSAMPARAASTGAAWFRLPQLLSEGFVMEFALRISGRYQRHIHIHVCAAY
jgi:hypothetical protein